MFADKGITSDVIHPDMSKIVKQDTWLIGVSGEDRMCDILQYAVKYPKPPANLLLVKNSDDWFPWVVTKVVPQILRAIEENVNKSQWGTIGESELLLVTHGHSFLISSTLGVTKTEPYWSIGSGAHLAMGSVAEKISNTDWRTKHAEYAKNAIAVAEKHDPFTRGEIIGFRSYPSGKVTSHND